MALFQRLSRLPVHDRHSPVAGGSGDGPQTWILGLALWAGRRWRGRAAAQMPPAQCPRAASRRCGSTGGRPRPGAARGGALFARSNITFTWIDPGRAGRALVIRIVSKPMGEKSRDPRVVGIAPGTRKSARETGVRLYERIQDYSAELGLRRVADARPGDGARARSPVAAVRCALPCRDHETVAGIAFRREPRRRDR